MTRARHAGTFTGVKRLLALVVGAALMGSACGGGSSSGGGSGPVAAGDTIEVADIEPLPGDEAFAGLEQSLREELAAGLEELGVSVSPDDLRSPAAAWAGAEQLLEELSRDLSVEFGTEIVLANPFDHESGAGVAGGPGRSRRFQWTGQDAAIAGAMTLAAFNLEAAARAANDFDTPELDATAKIGSGGGGLSISLQMSRQGNRVVGKGAFALSQTITADGQQVTIRYKGQATLATDICPDESGHVASEFRVTAESVSDVPGAGTASSEITFEGTADTTVDDSAEIAGVAIDAKASRGARTRSAATEANPASSYLEVRMGVRAQGADMGNAHVESVSAERVSSGLVESDVQELVNAKVLGAIYATVKLTVERAREQWQHGACVKLTVKAPSEVEPGSEHEVTAGVRHVLEGTELELPVTAEVIAGGESIDPSEAQGKPARFTYAAPDDDGAKAKVRFEVRSRRGADQKTVEIEVSGGAWTAKGGGDQITITGRIEDLAAPFTLQGKFQGGSATLSYTPTGESGGTFTYRGGGSGVTISGSGSYTVAENDDGTRTITETSNGCVRGISGTCKENSEVITLTRE